MQQNEVAFRKVCTVPFQILPCLAEWVSEHELRQGAQERILPEEHNMVLWGGEASAWVEIMLKLVLLLSRNIQERKRMKHRDSLDSLLS